MSDLDTIDTTAGSRASLVRVAIVDDHAIVRDGIERIVDAAPELAVAFSASAGGEFLKNLRTHVVDACVIDLSLPDMSGVELIDRIRESLPRIPILVFTMHSEESFGVACLKAGANGFLTKGAAPSELQRALREISSGRWWLSPVLEDLAKRLGATGDLPHSRLSAREMAVFVRIASGLRNNEISRDLGIDQRTVSTYRRRILDKLSVTSEAELVRYAVRHGLVAPEPSMSEPASASAAGADAVSVTDAGTGPTIGSLAFVGLAFVSLWETFMNGQQVALSAIDMSGTITHWSTHAEELYGWKRAEALGERLDRLSMTAEAITPGAAEAMLSLQQGRAWEGRLRAQHRDGSLFSVYVLHVGLVDDENHPVGLCALSVRADDEQTVDGVPERRPPLLDTVERMRRNTIG